MDIDNEVELEQVFVQAGQLLGKHFYHTEVLQVLMVSNRVTRPLR